MQNQQQQQQGDDTGGGGVQAQRQKALFNSQDLANSQDNLQANQFVSNGSSASEQGKKHAGTEPLFSGMEVYPTLKTALDRKNYVGFSLQELKKNGDITEEKLDAFKHVADMCGYKLELVKEGEGAWGGGVFKGARTLAERLMHKKTKLTEKEDNVASAAVLKEAKKLSLDQKVELRQYVINKTGRENGPDIALKVLPSIKDKEIYNDLKEIINQNSSITEVMNLLAFLTNNKSNRIESILKDLSIASGTHNESGQYTDPEHIGKEFEHKETDSSVFASLKGSEALFNIDTFESAASGDEASVDEIVYIPQGILKRDSTTYEVEAFKLNKSQIPLLISACILQMVNILENTRQVFGGWTKLFKEMQGGSSKPKNKSKKTRRRNRRIN